MTKIKKKTKRKANGLRVASNDIRELYFNESINLKLKKLQTDYTWQNSGTHVAKFSGKWNNASKCGTFYWNLNNTASNSNTNIGAHLKFLTALKIRAAQKT